MAEMRDGKNSIFWMKSIDWLIESNINQF
jgi:hypothetical protein